MAGGAEHERKAWSDADGPSRAEAGIRVSDREMPAGEAIAAGEIADPSPLGVVIMGGDPFVIRYINPAARRLMAVEDTLVRGRAFKDAFPEPRGRRIAALLRRVYRTGKALRDIEMRLDHCAAAPGQRASSATTPDNRWLLSVWRLPAAGDRGCGLVLLLDEAHASYDRAPRPGAMAELREINQRLLVASLRELELTERAEAANEAKSAFLATMSHELRTPLTAILGYEELLAEGIAGPLTPKQRQHLSRIKLGAQHLLTLIDGILSLSRLDAGRETVTSEPVSAERLIDEATTPVLPLARAKGIRFRVERPVPGFDLDTDHVKVRQILVNLLGNAVKFTNDGEMELSVRAETDRAIFTVRDTGVGISTEHLERIFDPFWQVEQTTTRTVGGTGLGLSVSQRLAQLLGGELTVSSTKGKGSEFTLRLPLHPDSD